MKNTKIIVIAVIFSAVSVLFLKELFQALAAFIFSAKEMSFSAYLLGFNFYFEPNAANYKFVYILLYTAPVLYLLILVEIMSLMMKKSALGGTRYFLIISILLHIGYLLIYIFYSSFLLIMAPGSKNNFSVLSIYLGLNQTGRIIFAFFIVFAIVIYMQTATRRLLKYINI